MFSTDIPKVSNPPKPSEIPQLITSPMFNAEALRTGKLSGINFITDSGEVIKAHREILKRLPALFSHLKLGEVASKREFLVPGLKYDVLYELIYYAYTGSVRNIASNALPLLKAAVLFDLTELKGICTNALIGGLTLDNFNEALLAAKELKLDDLTTGVFGFLVA
jgi:hypothetical protein